MMEFLKFCSRCGSRFQCSRTRSTLDLVSIFSPCIKPTPLISGRNVLSSDSTPYVQSLWSVSQWCYFKRQLYTSTVYRRNRIPSTFVDQEHVEQSDIAVKDEVDEIDVSDVDDSDTDLIDSDHTIYDSSDPIDYDFDHEKDSTSYNLGETEDSIDNSNEFETTIYQSLIKKLLVSFASSENTQTIAEEYRLKGSLYKKAIQYFKIILLDKEVLKKTKKSLYDTVINILDGSGHQDDLMPYFLELSCDKIALVGPLLELSKTSDLSSPVAWFPSGRSVRRKLVYHAGPTNSGKTHAAFQRFMSAKNAIYCAPLRMLAHEIFHRSNKEGVPCDLLTGEEAQFASEDETKPASHISCTVEMANIYPENIVYDVAVIDEIQMLKDLQRGGGWTRALLGLPAMEVHLCGDQSAIDLVRRLARSSGEEIEVIHYERLAPLVPVNRSLQTSFKRIRPGDCVVTFSRKNIFEIRKQIEKQTKHKCAVIYGGLPSATRVLQADLFNNPDSEYNVLVATDAVGMGLNLNIRRMVFHTMEKFDGASGEMQPLSASHVKQIAGRAGRYGKDHARGEVTTFCEHDLPQLHYLLKQPLEVTKQAGIYPSLEQILMFSSHLKKGKLHEILSLFSQMAKLDGNYFLCDLDSQMELAQTLSQRKIEMEMSDLFCFTLAPVDLRKSDTVKALCYLAKCFVDEEEVDVRALKKILKLKHHGHVAKSVEELAKMEVKHEILDVYLWLSMRYPDTFVSPDEAREVQEEIEEIIGDSILSTNKLISSRQPRKHRHVTTRSHREILKHADHLLTSNKEWSKHKRKILREMKILEKHVKKTSRQRRE